jgi:hypothetical protein
MKLTQSELDTLSAYQLQLEEMRASLRNFDLQVDEAQSSKGHRNPLQVDFVVMNQSLSSVATTMQKYIGAGA